MSKPLKIGNSYGLILTRDVLDELGVREGDRLFPVRTEDGRIGQDALAAWFKRFSQKRK